MLSPLPSAQISDVFELPPILDLAAADDFLHAVQQRAESQMPLVFDASAVETLTLPCVQIMLAAARDYGRISVQNPSTAFVAAFDDLGVHRAEILDCAEEQASVPAADADETSTVALVPDLPPGPPMDDEANAAPESDAPPISEVTMSKRIMTIDDSKTMRDMLMLTLADAGYDVLQAVDGQDGLDKLAGERVDVVITDINMPKMDGYEVIRQLRKNPAFRSTPILVLTTESEIEKRSLAREAGATGWMVKPFDPDRLIETVRKVAP
jgi:two-component system chemotaxis response regulator CheY